MPIENAPPAPFDAVDEYWFDDAASANAFFRSAFFVEEWIAPRRRLLADAPPLAIAGMPQLLWERAGPLPADPVKIIVLPVRRSEMTFEDFRDYWTIDHARLALGGPHTRERLRRLEDCPMDAQVPPGLRAAPFDGAGAIQFDSLADLQAEFAGDYYRDHLAPDEPKFTDPANSRGIMVEERIVYARP